MTIAADGRGGVALVTGGNRGIGKAIALRLAQRGVGVILTYRSNEGEAQAVVEQVRAAGVGAAAMRFDLTDRAGLDGFLDRLGTTLKEGFRTEKLDFLVNNAGIGRSIPIDKLTEADFETFSDIHFRGVLFLTQRVLRIMKDGGGVVFVTAAADRYNVQGYSLYAACKGAVEVFSRYVAKEYGPRGIRANTVAPGGVVTDFNNAAIRSNPKIQDMVIANTPMGRLAEADDIAGVVAALCSEECRWLTGQRLEATGGFML